MHSANSRLRILVVEDEVLFAEQLKIALEALDYDVVGPAHTATAALALFQTASPPPDVALLDIRLSARGMDGIALAERLLAERPLPLIFLTSQTDTQSFERARQVGPAAYLVKPVDPAALQRTIELAVSNFVAARSAVPDEDEPGESLLFTAGTGAILPNALFVKEDNLLVKVKLAEICWIVAEDRYSRLALHDGRTVLVRQYLRDVSQHLPADQFLQIHRSYIVNADCLERFDPVRNIALVAGQILPIGRAHRDALLKRLHLL